MGSFLVAVDWDNDGFINRFASRTDAPNVLEDWLPTLDFSTWNILGSSGAVSVGNGASADGDDYLGQDLVTVQVADTSTNGVYFWKSGGDYQIDTTSGITYKVVCWIKGNGASVAYTAKLFSDNYGTEEATISGTATTTAWTQVVLQFTAGASDNLVLQIYKTDAAARNFWVGGFMILTSDTGTVATPAGFNVGADGLYDNITQDVKGMNWKLGMGKPYQQMADEGVAVVTLENTSGLYSPENASSALYGHIDPLIKFEIGHWLGSAQNNYRVMYTGVLDSPPLRITWQGSGPYVGKEEATLTAISNKIVLDTQDFEYAYQSGESNIGGLVKIVAGAAQYGTRFDIAGKLGDRAGSVTNYSPQADSTAWQVISELVAAENGKFYLDRGGTANMISRYYSYSGSAYYNWGNGAGGTSTANAGTITETGTYKPTAALEYAYGANYINLVRATAHPRIAGASGGTVWQNSNADFDIEAGEYGTIIARLRDSLGRFTTADSLTLAAVSYTAGTAVASAEAKGGKGYIIFDNTAGTVTATAGNLVLTAQSQSQTYDISFEIDSPSVELYGIRSASYDFPAVSKVRDLRNLVRHIYRRDNQFQGYVYTTPFRNKGDGTANAHQLQWEIGKRVRVDLDNLYHDRDYWIIGERHTVGLDGDFHETTFVLEPTSASSFWLAGVTGYSEAGVTTRAGY